MRHRWSDSRRVKGHESTCIRCGLVKRYMDSATAMYLSEEVSGWQAKAPPCHDPEPVSAPTTPAFSMLADAVRRAPSAGG